MIILREVNMNAGTFLVAAALVLIVILDIRYLMKHGVNSCGGDCGSCHGTCKWSRDLKKAKEEIAAEKKNSLRSL